MKVHVAAGVFASLLALAVPASAFAADVRPVQGTVVMARGGSQPLYLWNATNYVAQLVQDKVLGDDGMHALEATALTALAEKAKSSSAKSVAIRVVYARTGAVSPVYGTPTFSGMENVFTLTADRSSLEKNASSWAGQAAGGKLPSGVQVSLTGKLPAQ